MNSRALISRKTENRSIANPSPNTGPNVPTNLGYRSPISKLSTVPVTTPTANSVIITFDQRRASVRYSSSPRLCRATRGTALSPGTRSQTPQRNMHGERQRLHLAGLEEVLLCRREHDRASLRGRLRAV